MTPTPTATGDVPTRCGGDCDGDGAVSIAELVRAVGDALAGIVEGCAAADTNDDRQVSIGELVNAVRSLLDGCPAS